MSDLVLDCSLLISLSATEFLYLAKMYPDITMIQIMALAIIPFILGLTNLSGLEVGFFLKIKFHRWEITSALNHLPSVIKSRLQNAHLCYWVLSSV